MFHLPVTAEGFKCTSVAVPLCRYKPRNSQGLALWYSRLNLHPQCQHPTSEHSSSPGAALQIQLPAMHL